MRKEEFDAAFEKITRTQRMVLKSFLAGKTDEAIAQNLGLNDSSTIRRHIANISRIFELRNEEGEHFSYRQELIELFANFQPDLVNKELLAGVKIELESPEGQVPINSIFYLERPPIEFDCYQEIRTYALYKKSILCINVDRLF